MQLTRSRGSITTYRKDPAARWHLVQGDCVEVLAKIPDRSVDLVIADPPYHLSRDHGTTCRSGRRVAVSKGAWDVPLGIDGELAFHLRWLEQVQACLKPSGALWVSGTHHVAYTLGHALAILGFHVLNDVAWCKPNATPNLACRTLTHSTERMIWAAPHRYTKLRHRFNYADVKADNDGLQLRDYWEIPTTPAREKNHGAHPTQKPEALYERVLAISAAASDFVVDPFCGSGTSAVCALRAGCRYLGVDLDAEHLDLTARRIAALEEG